MSVTPSTMLELGTAMPSFSLPDLNGRTVSDRDVASAPAVLVAFICPHCPYVKHVRQGIAQFARDYQSKGLAIIAINSNDTVQYPQDGIGGMKEEAAEAGYVFPYVFDEDQQVAKSYRAACTPDFFLFDRARTLVYRGQFDDSRPSKDIPVTGADLRAAADAVLGGRPVPAAQKPSVGCNIKWKAGSAPDYFPTAAAR
jgi:peroxiredoxin